MEDDLVRGDEQRSDVLDASAFTAHGLRGIERSHGGRLDLLARYPRRAALDEVGLRGLGLHDSWLDAYAFVVTDKRSEDVGVMARRARLPAVQVLADQVPRVDEVVRGAVERQEGVRGPRIRVAGERPAGSGVEARPLVRGQEFDAGPAVRDEVRARRPRPPSAEVARTPERANTPDAARSATIARERLLLLGITFLFSSLRSVSRLGGGAPCYIGRLPTSVRARPSARRAPRAT